MAGTQLPETAWPRWHDTGRVIAQIVAYGSLRVRVHGLERIPATGPLVLVANHSAMIDGVVLYAVLRRRCIFLVKSEFFRGAMGWFFRRLGQIPVRRGEPDRTPLLVAVRVLRDGGMVGVFPEGTRGVGDVANAHHGATWLARSGGAVLLPVAIRGTRRPDGRGRRFRPRAEVLIGEPFPAPTGKGRAALAAATDEMRARLVDLVGELDARLGYPDGPGGRAGGSERDAR